MVEIGGLKDQDHEVLGIEYCSGYTDSFGKWNTGFYCPTLGNGEQPVYCCGTILQKYCCTKRDEDRIASPFIDQTTLLGIVLGCMILVVCVTLASCLLCRRCVMRRKRQHAALNGGPLYQMHCSSSTGSGVANMYTFTGGSAEHSTPMSPLEAQMELNVQGRENVRREYITDEGFNAIGSFPVNNEELTRAFRTLHMNYPLSHSDPPPPYRERRSNCSSETLSNICPTPLRPGFASINVANFQNGSNANQSFMPTFRSAAHVPPTTSIIVSSESTRPTSTFRPHNSIPSTHRDREQRITHI